MSCICLLLENAFMKCSPPVSTPMDLIELTNCWCPWYWCQTRHIFMEQYWLKLNSDFVFTVPVLCIVRLSIFNVSGWGLWNIGETPTHRGEYLSCGSAPQPEVDYKITATFSVRGVDCVGAAWFTASLCCLFKQLQMYQQEHQCMQRACVCVCVIRLVVYAL